VPYKVAAFYQFAALPDFRELREPLRALCASLHLKGSVLLAHEGINGTLAGAADAIDELVNGLREVAEILPSFDDAVPTAEDPAEKRDRHPRRNGS
jgi:predicted sulfurtransferase